MAGFYEAAAAGLRRIYSRHIDTPPVLDAARWFPGHADFERQFPAIRAECIVLMREMGAIPEFHELMAEQAELSQAGGRYWRMFVLRAYGAEHRANQARCPTLARLLRAHPEVTSATLSFLESGKHIPAHRGPFRGVLRYHLGLVVPARADGGPGSVLQVAGRDHVLQEGRGLLWDDTYQHAAWNEGTSVRAVLLLDVFRPGMPAPLRLTTRAIVSSVGLTWRLTGGARR